MPPRIGFKRPIPSSSRKLRPLSRRISSVEKTIDLVEDLIHFESEEDNKSTSSDHDSFSSKSPPFSPTILNTNDQGDNMDPLPPPIDEIDPMMRPRGLPIVVPPNLREIPIPTHLPKFSGSPHEDPTAHVKRFEELLVSTLVTNPGVKTQDDQGSRVGMKTKLTRLVQSPVDRSTRIPRSDQSEN